LYAEGGQALVHVTFVDENGISVYIARGFTNGGDIEGFIPKKDVMWQSYFEPLSLFNMSYVRSRHHTKTFPNDFVSRNMDM
jgi:hypothetical protein